MAIATYTKTGTKATTAAKLSKDVFDIEVTNHTLLKQAYEAYRANGRTNNATTKLRGEVRGGGRKPWKQKGTGRARVGSIRSPLWRGGGITFGPSGDENYSKKLSTKAKQTAIRQALSLATQADRVVIIEDFQSKDGKTKPVSDLMKKLGADRRTLIVVENKTPEIVQATNNLDNTQLVQATYLNVFTVMNADKIVMTKKAVEIVETWLGGTK